MVVPCPLLVTSTTMDTMTSSLGQTEQTLMVTTQVSPMSCLARQQGYSASLELSSLNGTNGFVINGIDEGDYSGSSVSSAGDINNDGYDDIIIGADGADPNGDNSGESYVVFGKATGSYSASLELSSLNGTNGFVINGIDEMITVVIPCPLLVTSTTMDTMTSSLGHQCRP